MPKLPPVPKAVGKQSKGLARGRSSGRGRGRPKQLPKPAILQRYLDPSQD